MNLLMKSSVNHMILNLDLKILLSLYLHIYYPNLEVMNQDSHFVFYQSELLHEF